MSALMTAFQHRRTCWFDVEARHRMGDPIYILREARAEEFKRYQEQVEEALNAITARAYTLAGADMTRATPLPRPPRAGQSQNYYDQWK
jgi:hypothetical protein